MHTKRLNYAIEFIRRNAFPLLTVGLFAFLFLLAVLQLMHEARVFVDQQIAQDIEQLSTIFRKIDKECHIIGFAEQKNAINFLNVKKFAGSEVGPMRLMFPDRWKGPYVQEHLSVFGRPYLIIRTKKGYFITPPEGVQLGNGKTVGTDISLAESSNIPALMKDAAGLNAVGTPLAAPVPMSGIQGPMTDVLLNDEE